MTMPTFTPESETQDERLNPGQQYADRQFDLSNAEKRGSVNPEGKVDNDETSARYAAQRERESADSTASAWKNNTTEKNGTQKARGWFKKASPALGIGGVVGIGGFVMLALTSPSLLIVQMKETMTERFNTQLSSMDARSNRLIRSKIDNSTSGVCGKVTIRCKFSSMSDRQIAKMRAAGIEVVPSGKTSVVGRTIPSELRYNGETIDARNFASTAGKNPQFRKALRQAYNPKFAGFTGKAWVKVASHFKISKKAPELDAEKDPAKARTKINTIAKEGSGDITGRTALVPDDEGCEGSNCITKERADEVNSKASAVEASAKSGDAAAGIRSKLSGVKTGLRSATSFFKITGLMDTYCQVHGGMATLTYASKTIRAAQLVRYAMIFFSIADAIKAGQSPNPKDVELLGTVLTSKVIEDNAVAVGDATSSFGYKFAAYGDTGGSDKSKTIANRFIAGGGFVGSMSSAVNSIMSMIPGGRKGAYNTCHTLANPLVQGTSLVLGVASLLVPGANVAKIGTQAAASVAVGIVLAVLPGLIADIVAGTVTKDIVGEESGNAITSGAGSLMSDSLAAQNGNGPMTKEDAVAYNSLQTDVSNQYIADELRTTSPFDATNPHTFVGSIVARLLPLQSSSNPITQIGSLFASSLGSLTPKSSAASNEDFAKSLDICQDPDILDGNYAADPFCNVIRGIPPKYLNKDPLVIIDELERAGDIAEDGTPQGNYAAFIDKCIDNSEPLGYKNASSGFNEDDAKSCIVSDSNANYYLNYMDQQIELGMSGEDVDTSPTTAPSTVSDASVDEAALFTDGSSVQCAAGTVDKGISTGYRSGKPVTIRTCELSNTNGALVNSRASGVAYAMFEKMRTDLGLNSITVTDSYRTMATQQRLKARYGAQAAAPGYSNHQMGFAFDINMGSANGGNATGYVMNVNSSYPGNKVWEWLKANAATYHFSQYSPEGWHWSINGS